MQPPKKVQQTFKKSANQFYSSQKKAPQTSKNSRFGALAPALVTLTTIVMVSKAAATLCTNVRSSVCPSLT